MSEKLVKSGVVVSSMTLVSRVMGLCRDIIVANLLGAGGTADVFYFANRIPNFLRRLFAEGAFAQAFIPVLSEVHHQQDMDKLRLFIARASGTLGTLVLAVTLLGVVGSPVLAAIFGTGWLIDATPGSVDAAKFDLAAAMLKITFPYLMFISLTALSGAILNTLNRFAVAAFTPVLLNVSIISAALWLSPHMANPAVGLAWGVFGGGVLQLLFQLPFLYRAKVLVKPQWGWNDPAVIKVRKLMLPALFGVSVSQINLLFDTMIASFLQDGSISWLYYADRLLEFPLGLFGIAIATVILPTLSRNHVAGQHRGFSANMDWAVRMVCWLGLPAAGGLIMLAQPMLTVLFQRGQFSAHDSQMASYSLMAYASGLLCFMLIKVLAPGFYSRQDTKTPVKYGVWAMLANMVFNLILAWQIDYVGLALATSLSAALNAGLLYQNLHKKGVYRLSRETLIFLAQVFGAVSVMCLLLYWLCPATVAWQHAHLWVRGGWLLGLICAAVLTYITVFILLGGRLAALLRHQDAHV